MTDQDTLKALFKADEAPAVDPSFRMAVMNRVAGRRLALDLVVKGTVMALLGTAFVLTAPLVSANLVGMMSMPQNVYVALGGVAALTWVGRYVAMHRIRLSLPRLNLF
jgi:hypothetical protein